LKKTSHIIFFLFLFVSWQSSGQIITSKKEALKKGLYSYVKKENNINTDTVTIKTEQLYSKPTLGSVTATKSNDSLTTNEDRLDIDFTPTSSEGYLAQQIINNAMEFEGVVYRSGGTTKNGVDCSGLIYTSFNTFDFSLPRTSREMAESGEEIALEEVKKGDLLFFATKRKKRINHVGLVTEVTPDGEVKFIHASSRLGVTVSSMYESYYKKKFIQANRVINTNL